MRKPRIAIRPLEPELLVGNPDPRIARIDRAIAALIDAAPDCPRWVSQAVDCLSERRDALLEQEVWA